MALVLNLNSGPGGGKSTTAAGLFHTLKLKGIRCELVTEYAKDLTYEAAWSSLSNQWLVIGKQDQRLRRLIGQVDIIVTDSPLPAGLLYAKPPFTQPWFAEAVWQLFDSYSNFNIMLRRTKAYQPYGRSQTEEQAKDLDEVMRKLLVNRIDLEVDGNEDAPNTIFQALVDRGLIKSV